MSQPAPGTVAEPAYDLVIRGAQIVDAGGSAMGDLAVRDGRIAAIGHGLPQGAREIAAEGLIALPGGVDSHCHIEQVSGNGVMNADTFETAHRAALMGGTTTTISFAAQHPGMRLGRVMADYHALAARGAMADHAFHAIVADISDGNLDELAELIRQGHRSIKIFTTYDKVRLDDAAILDVLETARAHGAMVCFHAENDAMIRHATARLLAEGRTHPRDHAASHPRLAEIEALERVCRFAEYTGQPVMLFHISTVEGLQVVRAARARGVPVTAETCTHYLFQTEAALDRPVAEAAGFLCSPPQRQEADRQALWAALADGTLAMVTSDHAPYRLDESGKFIHGQDAPFPKLANGQPGLEQRLPVLFDAIRRDPRFDLSDFAELTAAAPARQFGLPTKGHLRPGADADIVLWDPERRHVYGADDLHDNVGYNTFAGHEVTGWPVTVISRGEPVVEDGALTEAARPGRGQRLEMERARAMRPTR